MCYERICIPNLPIHHFQRAFLKILIPYYKNEHIVMIENLKIIICKVLGGENNHYILSLYILFLK